MSGVTATLEIDIAPIHAIMEGLRAVEPNLFDPLDAIGQAMSESTRDRFGAAVSPDGVPWAPLKRPKKRGTILITEGILRDSFSTEKHNWEANDASVEWGTNVAYAAPHQFGATILHHAFAAAERQGFGLPFTESISVLPARPFLGVNDNDYETMREILVDFISRLAGVNPQSGGAA